MTQNRFATKERLSSINTESENLNFKNDDSKLGKNNSSDIWVSLNS